MWHTDKNNNKLTVFSALVAILLGWSWSWDIRRTKGRNVRFFALCMCVCVTFMSLPTYALDVVHCYCYPQAFILMFFSIAAERLVRRAVDASSRRKHNKKTDNQSNIPSLEMPKMVYIMFHAFTTETPHWFARGCEHQNERSPIIEMPANLSNVSMRVLQYWYIHYGSSVRESQQLVCGILIQPIATRCRLKHGFRQLNHKFYGGWMCIFQTSRHKAIIVNNN